MSVNEAIKDHRIILFPGNITMEQKVAPDVTTILFDCDNTLVLSEDLAFEASAELVNSILAKHGSPTQYTSDGLIEAFVGQKFRGMLSMLVKLHQLDLPTSEFNAYVQSEEDAVVTKLTAQARPCVGANEILEQLHAEKKYNMAVVSSSASRRIEAALDAAGLFKFFQKDRIFSAISSLPVPCPKPSQLVYRFAMDIIGVGPAQCIAVEDSRSGAISALRAGIRTIAYVGSYNGEKKQKEIGNLLLKAGCCRVMTDWTELPEMVASIESDNEFFCAQPSSGPPSDG